MALPSSVFTSSGLKRQDEIDEWISNSNLYGEIDKRVEKGIKDGRSREEIELEIQEKVLPRVRHKGDRKDGFFINNTVEMDELIKHRVDQQYEEDYNVLQINEATRLREEGNRNWKKPIENQDETTAKEIDELYSQSDEISAERYSHGRLSRDERLTIRARENISEDSPYSEYRIDSELPRTEKERIIYPNTADELEVNSRLRGRQAIDDLEESELIYSKGRKVDFETAVKEGNMTTGRLRSWGFDENGVDEYFTTERGRVKGFTPEGREALYPRRSRR
jgi:hypothetical protein